ncbi:MAG: mechanosensitive ion channel protein MscS [Chloroflexota bacterium]|nr:MAG: mechanosensitive ion channel protein MscS [Chloroflexota bacterium]
MFNQFRNFITADTLAANLGRLVLILFLTWLVAEVGSWLAVRMLRGRALRWRQIEERRLLTLQSLVGSAVRVMVWIAGVVVVLFALGIPAGAILTALGLFSAGFGLGARPLINDYLAGMVLIFEDQFSVGEKVEMLEVIGTVEAVELRTTRLRAMSGELFIVPNGEVRVVRNLSRGSFSVANIKVTVVTADLARALEVLEDVADTAQTRFPELMERPEVLSIEGAISNRVELTLVAKAAYGRGAQLRPQLMTAVTDALEQAGVQIVG